MLENESSIIQDYFSFLKGELIEVLECLSKGDPWQDHMMGYELPEHSDGVDSTKDGITIFMQTYEYNEINIENSKFYSCLNEICDEYLIENPHTKEIVDSLMIKVKDILKT
ncbi:hypothetical protein [Cohnella terricola]|uniref:CDI immunity protein domain-containing protein n=1 Tax=Cohnella terricola TaxID=1289167 RepID=A0A559J4S8_9BACL|nr:hypothetical protein [Cohnella terricola]TVX94894.1 hypothetical protein FPZ45_24600 [Cohnella terricola]